MTTDQNPPSPAKRTKRNPLSSILATGEFAAEQKATDSSCVCDPVMPAGKGHIYATTVVNNLIGIQAKITTRYGKLCCEPDTKTPGRSVAHISITLQPTSGNTIYFQMGYGRIRDPLTHDTIINTVYCESGVEDLPGHPHIVDFLVNSTPAVPAPVEGNDHIYKLEIDLTNGKCSFYYDDKLVDSITDSRWVGTTGGNHAIWSGEVINYNDQMPGTKANPCHFVNCLYMLTTGGYVSTNNFTAFIAEKTNWSGEVIHPTPVPPGFQPTAFDIWRKSD